MSMFLAVVALMLAFGALWFTSEVARRLDLRQQSELKPNMVPVQDRCAAPKSKSANCRWACRQRNKKSSH